MDVDEERDLQRDVQIAATNPDSLTPRYSQAAINDLIRLSLYMDTSLLQDERSVIRTADGVNCYPLKVTSQAFDLRPQAVLPVNKDLEFMVTEIEIRDSVTPACEHYSRSHVCTNVWYPRRDKEQPEWTDPCVVCIFGCTAAGESVAIMVRDFKPYFFIECQRLMGPLEMEEFREALLKELRLKDDSLVELQPLMLEHYYGWEPAGDDYSKKRRYPCLKISLPNTRILKRAIKIVQADMNTFQAVGLGEYDTRVDIIQHKFSVESEILPYQWAKISAAELGSCLPDGYCTHCQIELECKKSQLQPLVDRLDVPPLLFVSVDGEMFGSQGFPNPSLPSDACIGIGLTFQRYGQDAMKRFYLALHLPGYPKPAPTFVRDTDIILWFDSEDALHEAYRDLLVVHGDVDIVTTYNGKNFDNEYWEKRMQRCCRNSSKASRFFRLSRFIEDECHVREDGITTQAKGENKFTHVPMNGRVQYDMYRYVKDDYKKLPDNTLRYAAATLLPEERKNDLSVEQMFAIWRRHLTFYGAVAELEDVWVKVKEALNSFSFTGIRPTMQTETNVDHNTFPKPNLKSPTLVSVCQVADLVQTAVQETVRLNCAHFRETFITATRNVFEGHSLQKEALAVLPGYLEDYEKKENCCPDFWDYLCKRLKGSRHFRESKTRDAAAETARLHALDLFKQVWDQSRSSLLEKSVCPQQLLQENPRWRPFVHGLNLDLIILAFETAIQFYDSSLPVPLSSLEDMNAQLLQLIREQPDYQNIKDADEARQLKQQKLFMARFRRECYPVQNGIALPAGCLDILEQLVSLELLIVAKYCIQDCDVVLHLMSYFANVTQDIEMSRVTYTSVEKLIRRGQQLKIYSQLMWFGKKWGFLINDPPSQLLQDHGKYEGAIVLEPIQGFYTIPVMIMDFASLYPSIMRQHNLSPDTEVFQAAYSNLPGIDYTKRTLNDGRTVTFVKHIDGIQPKLLSFLLGARKVAKRKMGQHDKAIGVLEIIQSILENGLEQTVIELEVHPEFSSLVQGEGSILEVLPALPSFVFGEEASGLVDISKFMQLLRSRNYKAASPLLTALLKHHKTKSKQYNCQQLSLKISANSIYGFNGVKPFKSEDPDNPGPRQKLAMLPCIDVAETVTHIGREMINQTKRLTEEHFGGKVVYGDSVPQDCPVLIRYLGRSGYSSISELPLSTNWLSYHGGKEYALAAPGLEVWSDTGFTSVRRVIRHVTTKQLFEVTTAAGWVVVTEDHSLLRPDSSVVKPTDITVGSRLLTTPFPPHSPHTFTCEPTIEKATQLWYQSAANPNVHKSNTVESVTNVSSHYHNSAGQAMVYDLETENHHFAAGVGQLVVHNTDSVMAYFENIHDVPTAFKEGSKVAKYISDSFGGYIELELENVAFPYLLRDKKKQYCKRVWMNPDKPEKNLDIKGISAKRRDVPPFVKTGIINCLNAIMESTESTKAECLERAEKAVLHTLELVINNLVPFQDYIKSMSMKDPSSYANDNIVQVRIYNKRKSRRPGSEPHAGDRVDYVIVVPDKKTAGPPKLCDMVEDPEYLVENNEEDKVDRKYYVDHYFRETINKLLVNCMPPPRVPDGLFTMFDSKIRSKLIFDQGQFKVENEPEYITLSYKQPPPSRKIKTAVLDPSRINSSVEVNDICSIARMVSPPQPKKKARPATRKTGVRK